MNRVIAILLVLAGLLVPAAIQAHTGGSGSSGAAAGGDGAAAGASGDAAAGGASAAGAGDAAGAAAAGDAGADGGDGAGGTTTGTGDGLGTAGDTATGTADIYLGRAATWPDRFDDAAALPRAAAVTATPDVIVVPPGTAVIVGPVRMTGPVAGPRGQVNAPPDPLMCPRINASDPRAC